MLNTHLERFYNIGLKYYRHCECCCRAAGVKLTAVFSITVDNNEGYNVWLIIALAFWHFVESCRNNMAYSTMYTRSFGRTTWWLITLAIAVCLYICVTSPMTSVKGLSELATPDPIPFIRRSHSAKLATASCESKETAKTVSLHPFFFLHPLFRSLLLYCFWDIKGKTINGAAGCPTFPGTERKREGKEKKQKRNVEMENSQGCHPLRLCRCVRWVMSVSQL